MTSPARADVRDPVVEVGARGGHEALQLGQARKVSGRVAHWPYNHAVRDFQRQFTTSQP